MRVLQWLLCCCLFTTQLSPSLAQAYSELFPLHPLLLDLMEHAYKCSEGVSERVSERVNNTTTTLYCDDHYSSMSLLAIKVSNEHTNILLHESVRSSLTELLELIDSSSMMGRKISHICAMLLFSQGNIERANKIW